MLQSALREDLLLVWISHHLPYIYPWEAEKGTVYSQWQMYAMCVGWRAAFLVLSQKCQFARTFHSTVSPDQ